MSRDTDPTIRLEAVACKDRALVGSKNASLEEMISPPQGEGIRDVPGFAATASTLSQSVAVNALPGSIRCPKVYRCMALTIYGDRIEPFMTYDRHHPIDAAAIPAQLGSRALASRQSAGKPPMHRVMPMASRASE
jgi:hypothetical protein